MATYKVIQDIEAEDKFVGPLTLRQFVFAMGGLLFSYLCFFVVTKGAIWALTIFAPPALFGFFMAVPWSKDQPTDVWVLAKIRFRIKPRKRIWSQSGMQELVTITAPKVEEKILTDNLSQTEVKSRLKILAETIDSRGWIVKNAPLQMASSFGGNSSDRLIDLSSMPQQVSDGVEELPDMLEQHEVDDMLQKQDQERKTQLYAKMDRIRQGEPLESINTPEPIVTPSSDKSIDENLLSEKLKAKREAGDVAKRNMSSIPATTTPITTTTQDDNPPAKQSTGVEKAQASVTTPSSPDIISLARNNDLNVSTIARQASSETQDEVVISLH